MEVANGVSLEIPPVPFNLPLLFALRGGGAHDGGFLQVKAYVSKDKFQTGSLPIAGLAATKAAAPLSKGIKLDFLTRFTTCIFVLPESW